MKHLSYVVVSIALLTSGCLARRDHVLERDKIKEEIDAILKTQEDAYDLHSEEGRKILAATCVDSLIFIGGDDGGQATSANYYVHDLADGYSTRPHQRTYRIFEQTVIVTSIYQSFKIFATDTIYFNARSTKVFVKVQDSWKMAFTTYAPLPVVYHREVKVQPEVLKQYVGVYALGDEMVDSVVLIGNRLWQGSGAGKSELLPLSDSIFFTRDYFGKTGFTWRNGKVVNYFYEFPDGQRLTFSKIAE